MSTGKRTYDLRRQAGTVHDPTKQIENITHVSGGYNSNVTTTHTRLTHVQFFIRSRTGDEDADQRREHPVSGARRTRGLDCVDRASRPEAVALAIRN